MADFFVQANRLDELAIVIEMTRKKFGDDCTWCGDDDGSILIYKNEIGADYEIVACIDNDISSIAKGD